MWSATCKLRSIVYRISYVHEWPFGGWLVNSVPSRRLAGLICTAILVMPESGTRGRVFSMNPSMGRHTTVHEMFPGHGC
ncbi:hypothetical protein LY76DRAFT_597100 [Colletotrichum caudatum]|nr:hypothetical protein LY76DRAFT_597100 [Colletotrichum caudatum]